VIGLLNFHYSNNNYGAVLQAGALQFVLSELGYDSVNIDLKYKKSVKSKFKKLVFSILRSFPVNKDFPYGDEVFEAYRSQWIKTTPPIYDSAQLYNIGEQFCSVIVGSDQVWRLSYTRPFHTHYFFDFCKDAKKIAYAASFGTDDWEGSEAETRVISGLINEFSAISVREKNGVGICKESFNAKAFHVLDPTFLAGRSYFDKVIANEKIARAEQRADVVYYKLDTDSDFDDVLNTFTAENNLSKQDLFFNYGTKHKQFNSVPAWLRKIRDSKLVITDSFHCICLAIMYQKDFVYYPSKNRGMSRLKSLLGELGLESRIVYGSGQLDTLLRKSERIHFTECNRRLIKRISASMEFLKQSLES